MASPDFALRMIGKGDLAIPAALQGKATKEANLAYEVSHSSIVAQRMTPATSTCCCPCTIYRP